MVQKHSVFLKEEKCEGCTNCVKRCPTKAIRVHQGKATIKEDLCIDCAECIRTCQYHAKYTETASLTDIKNYNYPVALIPPSFYGQFTGNIEPEKIRASLYRLGFKEIGDIAIAAEAISWKTANFLQQNRGYYISSSCPVVVRLIKILYQELLEHLIPFKTPVELLACRMREKLREEAADKDIGIFLITPCPAKLTTVNNPLGMEKSYLNGAIAAREIYDKVLDIINDIEETKFTDKYFPYRGINWGQTGGEEEILSDFLAENTLSISGIPEVKKALDEISRNNIKGVKYFEMAACPQGCVGGVLNIYNPFQAKINLKRLSKKEDNLIEQDYNQYKFNLSFSFREEETGRLDEDIEKAMEKLTRLEEEIDILPGLDCASCGAPDCKTLAEDIVTNKASRTDCIFMLRKEIVEMADKIANLTQELPPVMSRKKKGERNEDK